MHIDNVIFLILSKNAYTKFSAGPYNPKKCCQKTIQFYYYHPPNTFNFVNTLIWNNQKINKLAFNSTY